MKSRILTLIAVLFLTSCSVYMAANQEDRKDLSVLEKGTPRAQVIAGIGVPERTDNASKGKVDYFSFTQGYSTGSKTARAVGHGVASV